jgi:hypothetical protein
VVTKVAKKTMEEHKIGVEPKGKGTANPMEKSSEEQGGTVEVMQKVSGENLASNANKEVGSNMMTQSAENQPAKTPTPSKPYGIVRNAKTDPNGEEGEEAASSDSTTWTQVQKKKGREARGGKERKEGVTLRNPP